MNGCPGQDGMERLSQWLDAVKELAEAARSAGHTLAVPSSTCRLCRALTRYDAANDKRNEGAA